MLFSYFMLSLQQFLKQCSTISLLANVITLFQLELVQRDGYPLETHYVTTKDGYILTVHRIPTGKGGETNGKVVYLQHGLLLDTTQWVLLGPESENALGKLIHFSS